MTKEKLRQKMLALRLNQIPLTKKRKSLLVSKNLFSLSCYSESRNIMVYFDFKGEINTGLIIQEALKEGKKVLFPDIIPKTRKLNVFELRNFKKGFKKGYFGIPEPVQMSKRVFPYSKIDIVLVPGIAFDYKGFRIGFGGGYYDRFLRLLPKRAIKVGLAYDWQLVQRVSHEKHDICLDLLVTNEQIVIINKAMLKNL